jgi:hypothetical protein
MTAVTSRAERVARNSAHSGIAVSLALSVAGIRVVAIQVLASVQMSMVIRQPPHVVRLISPPAAAQIPSPGSTFVASKGSSVVRRGGSTGPLFCCPQGQHCVDTQQGLCCPAGQDLCGTICCSPSLCVNNALCCPSGTKPCPGQTGGQCCQPSQDCLNGQCGNNRCGNTFCNLAVCCNGVCCEFNQTCGVNGQCQTGPCPPGQVPCPNTPGACCPPNLVCCGLNRPCCDPRTTECCGVRGCVPRGTCVT